MTRHRIAWAALMPLLLVACDGDSPPTGGSPPPPGVPGPPGPPPLACAFRESSSSRITYYVAVNEPGADNESCDGLSPQNQGGGHCPFRDFQSGRTFAILRDVESVRVEVRAGTYSFQNEGLTVRGLSSAGRAVLTAYGEESVVFDGGSSVRELVRVSGEGTTVERITFQNAGAHNIEVRGGRDHRIQCNRFLRNVASDSVKAGDGASQVLLRGNDFSQWDSQAIDLTAVQGVTIVENIFHDPAAADGNAIGAKLGSRDVVIARNRFERTGGLAFGGVGEAHDDVFEAFALVAEENRFEDLTGPLVKFYSCSGCAFRGNDVSGAAGGFVLGGERLEGPSGCAGGCRPTESAVVSGNRLRRMRGGAESGPNIFWGVFSTETSGLSAGANLYCHGAGDEARFLVDDRPLSFTEWTRRTGTDGTSRVASESEPACSGW